jgi:hypothetical protein
MSLIIHIVLKDLRAQRWLVALWAVILAATWVIEAFKLDAVMTRPAAGGTGSTSLVYLLAVLAFARVALGWVLAIRFVHADPAEGTDAFWLTRPISPRLLMASKACLVFGLLLFVPGLLAAFTFVMNGVPWTKIPAAVLGWMLVDAFFVVSIAFWATLTRDIARTVLSVLALAMLWAGVEYQSASRMLAPVPSFQQTRGAFVLLAAAFVISSVALAALQYHSRRTARTVLLANVVGIAILVLAAAWPVRAIVNRDPRMRVEWKDGAGVTVEVPPDSVRISAARTDYQNGPPGINAIVSAGIRAENLPGDCLVRVSGGKGVLRAPGEPDIDYPEIHEYGFGVYTGGLNDVVSRERFERAVGARLLRPRGGPAVTLLRVSNVADYERYRGRPAAYEATLEMAAVRIGSVAAGPLQTGTAIELNGVVTTVTSSGQARPPGWTSRPGKGWTFGLRVAAPRAWMAQTPANVEVVVRNRRRGEAVVIWADTYRNSKAPFAPTFVVAAPGEARLYVFNGESIIDDAWLADAELVLVALEPLGRFDRTIRIENLVLPEPKEIEPRAPRP